MNAKKLRETGKKILNKDMNKETKEILNKLLEYFKESNINDFGYEKDKLISYKEAQILLDCITNLQEKIERLNNIIGKAIHYINLNQDSKSLCLNYEQLKALRGILRQDEFYLMLFENQLKELKGSVDE